MSKTITTLLFILLISAIVGITGIFYILSIAAGRTTVTTTYSLHEARQVAAECDGAHQVIASDGEWVVRCRN